jgi:hypothetical protein
MVRYRIPIRYFGIFIFSVLSVGLEISRMEIDAQGSAWESYSAATSKPAAPDREFLPQLPRQTARPAHPSAYSPRYHDETDFGFPRRQDPMFDQNPVPSWQPMIEDKPVYDRPAYDEPDYDAPQYRLEPVRKPTYEMPLAVLPIDDRPRYNFKYEEAPGYLAPTYDAPVDHAPNYVIKPYIAPAYYHPAYNQSDIQYNQPEYQAPVYEPEEYIKPREVPVPYIKPAE